MGAGFSEMISSLQMELNRCQRDFLQHPFINYWPYAEHYFWKQAKIEMTIWAWIWDLETQYFSNFNVHMNPLEILLKCNSQIPFI